MFGLEITDLASTLASFAAFAVVVVGVTNWVLRSWLKNYMSELKPNGGSSLKDSVNQINKDVTEIRVSLARLEGRFTQHLEDSDK